MDITQHIAIRIRQLRAAQGLSIEALAERTGVSRSNISLIERGESNPTATVLDKLATGLGVVLASLFEPDESADAPANPLSRAADQTPWADPASGYVRRHLSPAFDTTLKLVEVSFPGGQRVAYETAERDGDHHQQVWIIEGEMTITVGNVTWDLNAGDCLAMRLDQPIVYSNPSTLAARYLVAIVDLPDRKTSSIRLKEARHEA